MVIVQLMGLIDFHSIYFPIIKVNEEQQILKNIFFWTQNDDN